MSSDHQHNIDGPDNPGTPTTKATHPAPHPEKHSFAYRAGMRLGRRMTLVCSAISAALFASCMAWPFIFSTLLRLAPRFDPDDLISRWALGIVISFALTFLMIGAIGFARRLGWMAPQHAFAASIVSLGYGIIGAVASIAQAISFETSNSGAPEPLLGSIQPLLGRLDMTLLRASWVAWALAAAIAFSGLTIGRRLEPGLRATIGLVVGALLAPFTFAVYLILWMFAIVAPIAIFAVTRSSNSPKRSSYPIMQPSQGPWITSNNASYPPHRAVAPLPTGSAPPRPYAAPVRPSPPRPFPKPARPRPLKNLSGGRVLSIRLLGACATVLGALAACSVIIRITGIVTIASRRTLLALGVPIGFIAFIPVLVAIGLWASGRCSHTAVHIWGPVALACASAVGFAALYWMDATGGDDLSAPPLRGVLALCCGAALVWAVLVWAPYPPSIRILGGTALGMACMLLAVVLYQDAISVPPVIGLVLAGAFPRLRPLKFPEPAVANTSG